MRKTKLKNDSFWQVGMLPFVALWAGSYAAAWLGLLPLIEWLEDIRDFSQPEMNIIAISFILLVAALLQVQIVERLLKQSMRGWMLYSIVGTVMTFFTFRDSSLSGSPYLSMLITSLSLLVPVPLVQTVWLWRRVKSAWLWPLASIVAAIVFVLPLRDGDGGDGLIILAALLHGLVQGGIMRYLWMQPKDTEKSKVDFAAEESAHNDDKRTERLQAAAHLNVLAPWAAVDEQASERKSQ